MIGRLYNVRPSAIRRACQITKNPTSLRQISIRTGVSRPTVTAAMQNNGTETSLDSVLRILGNLGLTEYEIEQMRFGELFDVDFSSLRHVVESSGK